MNIYFLRENPQIKKHFFKEPEPEKRGFVTEIPQLSKLKKRQRELLLLKLEKERALYFAPNETEVLFPELFSFDFDDFFYSSLPALIKNSFPTPERIVLFDANIKYAEFFSDSLTDICLSGENALCVSEKIFSATGAALPVVSGCTENDTAVFFKDAKALSYRNAYHPNFDGCDNEIGADTLMFYPEGKYAFITSYLGRPLTTKDAARLSFHDSLASFSVRTKG